ncbi:hypothetical protein [Vibrio anguillarum]|uniref:hypothetical protein n=1 Tax=Vibrio anguillarum TaxID=55601 RepID=UPI00097E3E6C|nr:hypothetical protein [Vibrio anguillarum]MBT2965621.1 hypothetical protein [Vibrio anguillarum]
MTDLSLYKVDLDTPQPNGRKGESPRAAFTKYNDLLAHLEAGGGGSFISATEPTQTFAFMEWIDTSTTPAIIKRRNADDNAWITIGSYEKPITDFVDKVDGKGLSTNDYTNEDKVIVDGVGDALNAGKVLSTNDYTNEDKAIVDGVGNALNTKVDKVTGKELSTNDYTDEDKNIVKSVLWTSDANFIAGMCSVQSGQQYVAVQNSGPNNGGAVNPSTDTDWSHWKPTWALNQVENRLKGNQNWNIPGRTGHPLPDATPRDYPVGAEIALGVFTELEITNATLIDRVFSADAGALKINNNYDISGFFGIKLHDNRIAVAAPNSISGTGVSKTTSFIYVNINRLIALGIPRGAHKFVGCSELPGIWPDVSEEESADAVLFNKEYASVPIGAEIAFDTPPPTNDPRFRFVKLTADDAYNGSLLNNKVISGTAPNLVVKMTVNSSLSPINGQQIFMLNTMGAMPTPGLTSGVIIQDAMRNLTGSVRALYTGGSEQYDGSLAMSIYGGSPAKVGATGVDPGANYTISFDASLQVPTADRFQVFGVSQVFYKRIF